jgi:hypothetical protein
MDKKKIAAIAIAVAAACGALAEQLKASGIALPAWVTPVLVALAYLVPPAGKASSGDKSDKSPSGDAS